MPELQVLYTHQYHLTAAQCNAQGELAPAQLVQQLIEVSTEHADLLGVGFRDLQKHDNLWVLSRVTFEMKRFPHLLEDYSLTTWIEGYNRHFSERNIEIRSAEGEILGFARTIWVAINMHTRRPADLSYISYIKETVSEHECPIAKQGKIRPVDPPQIVHEYTFRVSDIDLNRHVNSTRYVELILNQMDIADFDEYYLHRFEIEYKHEAHYNDTVEVDSAMSGDSLITAIVGKGNTICLARSTMKPRQGVRPVEAQE
ncbi:MAG: thioesterase [Bacteroides sp.]|nr:thioesterase [Bacteroides sp.]MCM1413609.1 thioesterase [Bacteroides sp.]MCM1471174.1 thioesterase [Bacteroides sp.]